MSIWLKVTITCAIICVMSRFVYEVTEEIKSGIAGEIISVIAANACVLAFWCAAIFGLVEIWT